MMDSENLQKRSQEWATKIKGKRFVNDKNDTNVKRDDDDQDTVYASQLPDHNRVVGRHSIMTRDFRPERLNVILNDDQIVESVYYG